MREFDKRRVGNDARRHVAADITHPSRYSEAVNVYLGVFDYADRVAAAHMRPAPETAPAAVVPARRSVVVGVDDTPASAIAVDHAAIEAQLRGWDLRLVLVQSELRDQATERDHGAELLTHLVERVHAGTRDVAVVGRLLVGSPSELLLKEGVDAGLLVLGSRHGRWSDAFGVSVAAHVASHHHGPVMVVRMPAWPPGPDFVTRPVVIGVDGASEQAVAFGVAEARLRGCDVVLVHAEDGSPDEDPFSTVLADTAPDVVLHRRRVQGAAGDVLSQASLHAAAIVIGSRRHAGLPGLFLGSVGQRLIRMAHCPIFIAH